MRLNSLLSGCLVVAGLMSPVVARDMVSILVAKSKVGSSAGIYLSRMGAIAEVKRIKEVSSPNFAYFSPDGSKICYSAGGKLFIMNNNGTGADEVVASGMPTDEGQFSWTTAGILWIQSDHKIHKYNPTTKQRSIHLDFSSVGTIAAFEETMLRLQASGNGKKLWLRQSFTGNCEKSGAGGSPHPFVELNDDFSIKRKANICDWGHGEGMPLSGDVIFMNEFGTHFDMKTWRYVDGQLSDQTMTNMPSQIPSNSQGINGIVARCANNDSIMGKWCHNGEDKEFKYFAFNWRKTPSEHIGNFLQPSGIADGNKEDNLLLTDLWDGSLSTSSAPFMSVDNSQLTFSLSSITNAPGTQKVTVTNVSAGTLAKVTVSGAPSWLTVVVNENGGNTQTISNSIKMASLPNSDAQATITLSSEGSSNQIQYNVRLFLPSSLPSPGQLEASITGDSLLDVVLTWNDVANDETGFDIERTADTTKGWSSVATVGANIKTYTDAHRSVGEWYYRVRTVKNNSQSQNSNTANILVQGIEWIRITSPVAGQFLVAGSTVNIQWSANRIAQVTIELTVNNGIIYTLITKLGGVTTGDSRWGNYPWEVPQLVGTKAMIKITKYGAEGPEDISGEFQITSAAPVIKKLNTFNNESVTYRINRKKLELSIGSRSYNLKIVAPNGKVLSHVSNRFGSQKTTVPLLGKGVYLIVGEVADKKYSDKFIFCQ